MPADRRCTRDGLLGAKGRCFDLACSSERHQTIAGPTAQGIAQGVVPLELADHRVNERCVRAFQPACPAHRSCPSCWPPYSGRWCRRRQSCGTATKGASLQARSTESCSSLPACRSVWTARGERSTRATPARLWRSVKWEEVSPNDSASPCGARAGLSRYLACSNQE